MPTTVRLTGSRQRVMQDSETVSVISSGSASGPTAVVWIETARRTIRSGVLWGVVFGGYVAVSAYGYASSYPAAAQRAAFARTFGSNVGIEAIIGPAHDLQSVAGFTAWRSLGVISIIGAVWGLLIGTRLLRGEEEAGRWELLLAGQTTRRGAAVQALAGLAVGLLALWTVMTMITVAVGRSSKVAIGPRPALFLTVAGVSSAAVFLAVGALASQMAATRRQAASYAAGVLGAAYALRMVADSASGLAWLRWVTPLGWIENLRPLTSPQPLALLPIIGFTGLTVGSTVYLAGARDLDASTIPDRAPTRVHVRLLNGTTGLALRLSRAVLLGWAVAIALTGLMMGMVAKSAGQALSESASFRRMMADLGSHGSGAETYLGVAFLVIALLLAMVAAQQVGAVRDEEASGRLDNLLARPVGRSWWLTSRWAIAAVALVVGGLLAGISTWSGAASQGAEVGLAQSIGAGINVVSPALFLLGLGLLVVGVRPRLATGVVYGVLAWSFLIDIIGGIIRADHWLLDTSVFHQMAAAPAVPPDWTTDRALVGLGLATAALGVACFSRRDLARD